MSGWKVVVTGSGYRNYDAERDLVTGIGGTLTVGQCATEDDVVALARDADAMLVRMEPITARVMDACLKLRVVVRYGIGVDNVDVVAATRRGIVVANVVDYAVNEVAEQALAMLFSCARKITSHDKRVRAGEWDIAQKDPVHRMKGRTLGLVGLGRIPQALARKVSGMEWTILAYDPFVPKQAAKELGVTLTDLDTVLHRSDYVSVHAPLNEKTRHMIDESALRKMKPTAILVNTSRGAVVDSKALYRALREGWINSAGIDVHETEPVPGDYPFFALDNVVLADHAGWYSEESIAELQRGAAEAVVAVLAGGWPKFLVNPDVKETAKKKWSSRRGPAKR